MLNVTPDLPNVFENTGDIEYLQIPITDHWSQDLAVHFPAAIQFIGKLQINTIISFLCLRLVCGSDAQVEILYTHQTG